MRELTRLVTPDELQLYKVLLDETRESILDDLAESPKGMTATELARHFDLKLPTIMSHLKKLEQVGAIRKHERKGQHVNRPVVYYRASVRVGGFRERVKQVEAALDHFREDLSEAIFQFLQRRGEVVPALGDPTSLWEWLELLLKKTASSVAEIVVQRPERLIEIPKLQSLAGKVAALGLLNDTMFMVLNELWDLAKKKDHKLADVAKKYGVRKLRDETDALFILDVVEDLLSKNDSKKLRAQVALAQLVDMLPAGLSWKRDLQDILPYVVRAGELLDEKSANSLFEFEVKDQSKSSMISRWRTSARILKEALQKPLLLAAK